MNYVPGCVQGCSSMAGFGQFVRMLHALFMMAVNVVCFLYLVVVEIFVVFPMRLTAFLRACCW